MCEAKAKMCVDAMRKGIEMLRHRVAREGMGIAQYNRGKAMPSKGIA